MSGFLSAALRPERARSVGRPGWVTVVGLVLVPLLVGGLLVWALWQPDQRLDRIRAAVVNLDQPVTVNGQTVPLGRQLAAGLVTATGATGATASAPTDAATAGATTTSTGAAASVSGHDSTTNFTWVVTSASDAASGLTDGRYATVVTIPAGFSAAATSVGTDPANAQQATIDIATSERSRPVDGAVAQAVTSTVVRVLSSQLTTTYLQNVFVGFDTLRGSLQQASDGASKLATGASGVSSGATSLAGGASQLATGLGQLASGASSASSGASSLSSGVGRLVTGASALASGASLLSSGAGQLASGTSSLASGLDQLAGGATTAAQQAQAGVPGAQQLDAGLDALAAGITGTNGLAQGAAGLATGSAGLQQGLTAFGTKVAALAQSCAADPATCAALQAYVDASAAPNTPDASTPPNLAYLSAAAGTVATGAAGLDQAVNHGVGGAPSLASSATALAGAGQQLAGGAAAAATGLQQLAGAAQQSASGAHQLASGALQSASGASSLASGVSSWASGAQQSASGASSLASGVSSLASGALQSSDGASSLAGGASRLATGATDLGGGATTLADGLGGAVGKVPAYSTAQADRLAQVVADPVATAGSTTSLFGGASVPFFLVVALWLGGLATFVVLGATAPRVVGSTRSSLRISVTSFLPGAVVGVVQGAALTAAMAGALHLSPGGWAAFTALAALVGVVFAAVNQGLVAAFGGTGRFVSVIVAVVGLATAVVSTVPRLLDDVAGVLPIAPARAALQAVVTGSGVGGPVTLLVVWAVIGLALTTTAVARRRVVPAGRLARWVRAA